MHISFTIDKVNYIEPDYAHCWRNVCKRMSHSKRRKFLEKSELTCGSGYVWFLFVNDRKVPGGYKQEKLQSVNHCFVRDI